jgi:hypothetical protein
MIAGPHPLYCTCTLCSGRPHDVWPKPMQWPNTSGFGTYAGSCKCAAEITVLKLQFDHLLKELKDLKLNKVNEVGEKKLSAKEVALNALEMIEKYIEEGE